MDSSATNSILDQLTKSFRASDQKTPLIVYDIDDILWSLMSRIASRNNLDPRICYAIFDLTNNPNLTQSDRNCIISSFANSDIFRNIDFHPGASDILRPETLGAKVKINSNCYSAEIAELKTTQLLRLIPELSPDQIQTNIITYKQTLKKPLDPATTILVDDSPHNVADSPALLNIMPGNITWSCSPVAREQVSHRTVIWQPDLLAINDFVYTVVERLVA